MRVLFQNRALRQNFSVLEKVEAGVMLEGWEVKSIKAGNFNFRQAFVLADSEHGLMLHQAIVGNWPGAPVRTPEYARRPRQLLVSKLQVRKFAELAKRSGNTIVVSEVYVNDRGLIKLEVAAVRGRKYHERKQVVKERDEQRDMARTLKNKGYS